MIFKLRSIIYLNTKRMQSKFIINVNHNELNLTDDEKRKAVYKALQIKVMETKVDIDEYGNWKIISTKFAGQY